MPGFGKRSDGLGGRRSAPRQPTLVAAAILTIERTSTATIVNVSATGARLRGCSNVAVGTDLWIKVGLVDTLATVVWQAGDLCGVRFDEPIQNGAVQHLRNEGQWAMLTCLTPEERLAAEDWSTGFAR